MLAYRTKNMKTGNKENFLKVYANLPLGVREEIILVIDDSPITWNVAFIEVNSDTEKSKMILEKLAQLEII